MSERIELEHRILAAAEARGPVLLVTNTSALSIDELAGPLARPGAFLGLHFFNPVWSLHLVEIVRGAATEEEAVRSAVTIVEGIGKQAAVVADSPGFGRCIIDDRGTSPGASTGTPRGRT